MIKDKRLRLYSIFERNVVGIVVLILTLKAYFEYHSDEIRTNSSKTYWDVHVATNWALYRAIHGPRSRTLWCELVDYRDLCRGRIMYCIAVGFTLQGEPVPLLWYWTCNTKVWLNYTTWNAHRSRKSTYVVEILESGKKSL
jgi:hypothetical protein